MKIDSTLRRRSPSVAHPVRALGTLGTLAVCLSSCVAEAVALQPVGFGAQSFPQVVEHFNGLYLPFRRTGGAFTYGEHLVSPPGGNPSAAYNYQFEAQYAAYGGSTPTLQLTDTASGVAGTFPVGHASSVLGFYDLAVDILQDLPAGATKVPLELPVRISLLATRLPPGPPDFNTAASITAHITWTDTTHHSPQYLISIVGACMNAPLPTCTGNSVNIDRVVPFDVDPYAATRLGYGLDSGVRSVGAGSFDGYVNGTIDPLPRLSLTADPTAYGLPAGSKFSDYYALRFSPNLYTVAQLPVPEPSTWLLCAAGLVATMTSARRRTGT